MTGTAAAPQSSQHHWSVQRRLPGHVLDDLERV